MPVNIPKTLPARKILESENVFVMSTDRASRQDIRPLKVAILNLMPTKIATETQLLRLLGNSPLQVDITFFHMSSHTSKNTSAEHLLNHYVTFKEINNKKYDGLIITGAPVEQLPFEQVDYWHELTQVINWAETNVESAFYICWGAQAALYHLYGVPKYEVDHKIFGVFEHKVLTRDEKLLRGFDDVFFAPHSRHTEVRREDIENKPNLRILAESGQAGVYIVRSIDGRHFFVTGHSEYDPLTLKGEYDRDQGKGLPINVPLNYYPQNDTQAEPIVKWRGHANLLFSNWLNYYVYQITPFELERIPQPFEDNNI